MTEVATVLRRSRPVTPPQPSPPPSGADTLLTSAQAAAAYGLDPAGLRALATAGVIPSVRTIGGHFRLRVRDVEGLLRTPAGVKLRKASRRLRPGSARPAVDPFEAPLEDRLMIWLLVASGFPAGGYTVLPSGRAMTGAQMQTWRLRERAQGRGYDDHLPRHEQPSVLCAHPTIIRCRDERIRRGLTQQQIADRVGATREVIADVERGYRSSSAALVRGYAAVVEIGLSPSSSSPAAAGVS